jgi:hypothetical protein
MKKRQRMAYEIWSFGDTSYALYTEDADAMKLLGSQNFKTVATYHDQKGKLVALQFLIPKKMKNAVVEMLKTGKAPKKERTTRKVQIPKKKPVAETTEIVQGTLF